MNKIALAQKINSLSGLTKEEKAELTQLLNTKRYGLVWEDKPEAVEEELKTKLPILQEVVERKVAPLTPRGGVVSAKTIQQPAQLGLSFGETAPPPEGEEKTEEQTPPSGVGGLNHTLIEGDNLHALTVLNYTHANKIDVIYIDPPYNTGNKDFKYNDSFVDKEDGYRHSKWLSFMAKRLRLAKNLLSDKGVIFISIDDNEQAQLKLLCDEIFGEDNFIDNIIWEKNYAPRNDAKYFSAAHDFIIVYKKGDWERKLDARTDAQNLPYKHDDNNGRGLYRMDNVLVKTFSPSGVFPVVNPNTGKEYLPAEGSCWRYSQDTFNRMIEENRIYWGKDGKGAPQAKRYLNEVKQGTVPQTIWKYGDVGHTQDGKNELKDLALTNRAFETPKPSKLIKKIIGYDVRKNATILDFFAGSGTTLHAVMALNAEDGGSRQCILVTNNENNICEEVTYERNKRVIEGYYKNSPLTPKGGIADSPKADGAVFVPGLSGNNLRYYKTGYVGRERTLKNKKALVSLATEMLCLKEGVYQEKDVLTGLKDLQDGQDEKGSAGFRDYQDGQDENVLTGLKDLQDGQDFRENKRNPVYLDNPLNPVQTTSLNPVQTFIRLFEENGKAFMIIYDEEYIDEAIEIIKQLTNPVQPDSSKNPVLTMIKVYIFANGQYPYTEDFEEVLDKIELCALPDAIYRAYQRLLPKEE